jgi:hypothetical protein
VIGVYKFIQVSRREILAAGYFEGNLSGLRDGNNIVES